MIQKDSQVYIVINEQGTIESYNLLSEKLFGHKREDVKGKKIDMLFPHFNFHLFIYLKYFYINHFWIKLLVET